MNKKQLVAKISSTLGQSKADAERTFDSITTIILNELKMNNKQMSSNYLLGNLWNIIFLFLELFIYYFLLVIIFKKNLFGETATFIGVLVGLIHFRLINNIIANSARSILKNSNVLLQFKINPLIFFSVEFLPYFR